MSAPVDVLAVMEGAAQMLDYQNWRRDLVEARAAVAELVEEAAPLIASLVARINADNAMTPQAVMVRRAAAALARVGGAS